MHFQVLSQEILHAVDAVQLIADGFISKPGSEKISGDGACCVGVAVLIDGGVDRRKIIVLIAKGQIEAHGEHRFAGLPFPKPGEAFSCGDRRRCGKLHGLFHKRDELREIL